MIGVWPILLGQVDWGTFLRQAKDAIGVSPASQMDQQGDKVQGPAALLKVLATMEGAEYHELRHVHIGFAMHITRDEMTELTRRTDLVMTIRVADEVRLSGNTYFAVVSGTLDLWEIALQKLCRENSPTLELMNAIYLFLDQAGLAKFLGLRKVQPRDRLGNLPTFYLEK